MAAVDDITKVAKDALYVGVGLGVIAFQKAQVQRNELHKALKEQLGERGGSGSLSKAIDDRVKLVEERLGGVEDRVEALLDKVEDRLPVQAKELSKQARAAARDARSQVRHLVPRSS